MKVNEICIENFRKIGEPTSFQFAEEMIFVGKNNTGKTSISEIFRKFLSQSASFVIEDFNYKAFNHNLINSLFDQYSVMDKDNKEVVDLFYKTNINLFPTIRLDIELLIEDSDDFSVLKPVFFEFENNEKIIVSCRFEIVEFRHLINEYSIYLNNVNVVNETIKPEEKKIESISLYEFLIRKLNAFYTTNYYSTKKDSVVLNKLDSKSIITNIFYVDLINARRDVDDTSDQKSNRISLALWDYFTRMKNNLLDSEDHFKNAKDSIRSSLDLNYTDIFSDLITSIKTDILFSEDGLDVSISSDFEIESILKNNSKLKYVLGNMDFSESYNGLGFSNLIYIFVRVKLFLFEVKKKGSLVNILFIEEPESHLHPQVQSTFLEKIKNILVSENSVYKVISTHSSYILASSKIESIRYFCYSNDCLKIKSLSQFLYNNNEFDDFIKKYFKVSNCDLFFADKVIFIEGMSERILLPRFIEKIDKISPSNNLSKQHLSIIEVGGRYANIFYNLIDFLELRALIITDIDSVNGRESCRCDITEETSKTKIIKTSNPIIKEWLFKDKPAYIFDLKEVKDKRLLKKGPNSNERKLAFQRPLNNEKVWGRTFEEQFIIENIEIIGENVFGFKSTPDNSKYSSLIEALKTIIEPTEFESLDSIAETISCVKDNAYDLVRKIKKTDFALDIIASDDEWVIPKYIKDGLLWLMK